MNPPDNDFFQLLKELLGWLSAPVFGLIAWGWSRNEKEHEMLRAEHTQLQKDTSAKHSTINDRIMEYVDTATSDIRDHQRRQSDKANEHITKLFQNAELDRKEFHQQISDMREDSFRRHIELMSAIHGKADK